MSQEIHLIVRRAKKTQERKKRTQKWPDLRIKCKKQAFNSRTDKKMKTNQLIVTNTNYITLRMPQFLMENMFRMRQSNHILFLLGWWAGQFWSYAKGREQLKFSVMIEEMKQNYLFRKMKNFLYRFCHEPCSLHESICMLYDDIEN